MLTILLLACLLATLICLGVHTIISRKRLMLFIVPAVYFTTIMLCLLGTDSHVFEQAAAHNSEDENIATASQRSFDQDALTSSDKKNLGNLMFFTAWFYTVFFSVFYGIVFLAQRLIRSYFKHNT